jgi:D-alanine-D-alanine ligase
VNGSPGVSVIAALEKSELIYTGADDAFYRITTSKIPMKEAFDLHGVATASWQIMKESNNYDYLFDTIGSPLIVKPAVSGGSMGVGIKNVVEDDNQVRELIQSLQIGYRGWNLLADGLVAEAFINGPEYTSLVTGHYLDPDNIRVYEPVERVFHSSLPEKEQFLSFERLWEIYENESAMPDNENFYEYRQVNGGVAAEIKRLTKAAFIATRGVGYARADIRGDKNNGQLYMLEINAQCGISEDENFTSIGAILRFGQIGFHQLILEIIQEALNRHQHLLLAEQQRIFTSNI